MIAFCPHLILLITSGVRGFRGRTDGYRLFDNRLRQIIDGQLGKMTWNGSGQEGQRKKPGGAGCSKTVVTYVEKQGL